MTWTRQPLHPRFGARLEGERLGPDMDADAREALLAAVYENGVVVLRDQAFDEDSLGAFARSLGPKLMSLPTTLGRRGDVFRVANIGLDGEILPPGDAMITRNVGNEQWHTDMTYVRPRATVSMLYARIVPPQGGETQYCDTRVAFERLPETERARLRSLSADHSIVHVREATGYASWTEAERKVYGEPVTRPLVQYHAESGRWALCLASYICRIDGCDEAQAAALKRSLIEHATAPEVVYTHEWRPGDVVMWDNRCTMHRVKLWDQRTQKRELLTTRLVELEDA